MRSHINCNTTSSHGVAIGDVCDDFSLTLILDINKNGRFGNSDSSSVTNDTADKVYTTYTAIDDVSIPVGDYIPARIILTYNISGDRADAPFSIELSPQASLSFSSV